MSMALLQITLDEDIAEYLAVESSYEVGTIPAGRTVHCP